SPSPPRGGASSPPAPPPAAPPPAPSTMPSRVSVASLHSFFRERVGRPAPDRSPDSWIVALRPAFPSAARTVASSGRVLPTHSGGAVPGSPRLPLDPAPPRPPQPPPRLLSSAGGRGAR